MNKKISADDFHDAIERQLSGLEPDPWLAQRIIASDKEEVKVKKISHATVIIVAIIVLGFCLVLLHICKAGIIDNPSYSVVKSPSGKLSLLKYTTDFVLI